MSIGTHFLTKTHWNRLIFNWIQHRNMAFFFKENNRNMADFNQKEHRNVADYYHKITGIWLIFLNWGTNSVISVCLFVLLVCFTCFSLTKWYLFLCFRLLSLITQLTYFRNHFPASSPCLKWWSQHPEGLQSTKTQFLSTDPHHLSGWPHHPAYHHLASSLPPPRPHHLPPWGSCRLWKILMSMMRMMQF